MPISLEVWGAGSVFIDLETCTGCSRGTLNPNKNACCLVANCKDCSSADPSKCTVCATGLTTSVDKLACCSFSVTDCNKCSEAAPNACTGCAVGYLNIAKDACCKATVADCSDCSKTDRTVCTKCNSGFLSSDKQICCTSTVDKCNMCAVADKSKCTVCSAGTLNLASTACCQATNCQDCSTSDTSKCTTCKAPYVLTSTGKCLCPIDHCSTCSDTNVCSACHTNFVLSVDFSTCAPCQLANCVTCSADGTTCQECANGFYIKSNLCSGCDNTPNYFKDATGKCQLCMKNCLACSSKTTCTTCYGGFTLNADKTFCLCNVDNCEVCENESTTPTCKTCAVNYGMAPADASTCIRCTVTNCNLCKIDTNGVPQCTLCNDGYYIKSGTCEACAVKVTGCVTCSGVESSLKCDTCSTGSLLKDNVCFECKSIVNTASCVECAYTDSKYVCSSCIESYYLKNSQCLLCETLTSNCKTCDVSKGCLTCKAGYFLKTIDSSIQCVGCTANCEICNPSSCRKCAPGFLLDKNYLCVQCNTQSCQTCVISTIDDYSVICKECKAGYFLNEKIGDCKSCSTTLQNCLACTNEKQCLTCASGFLMSYNADGSVGCQSDCLEGQIKDAVLKTCTTCSVKYHGCGNACDANSCLSCPSNTYPAAGTGACSGCLSDKQILVNFKCVDNPIPVANKVECDVEFKTSFSIDCSVSSRVYLAYSLYSAANALELTEVISKTSSEVDVEVPYKEKVNWLAYASFLTNENGTLNATLLAPLKNSGEQYSYKLWCVSENGKIKSNAITGNWIQKSNKAETLPLTVSGKIGVNGTVDEAALLKSFDKLFPGRQKYLEKKNSSNGTNSTGSRLLQATDQFQYTCYILPDYSLQRDLTSLNVKNKVDDQAAITSSILASYNSFSPATPIVSIQSASLEATVGVMKVPNLVDIYPIFVAKDNQISFRLSVNNGNANIIVGYRRVLTTESVNITTIKFNYYDINTLRKAVNTTVVSYPVSNNVTQTITLSGLEKNSKYLVFYVGESAGYPKLYSDVYGVLVNEGTSSNLGRLRWVFGLLVLVLGALVW